MRESHDAIRPSRRLGSRELALATQGLSWAAATMMLAATVVIAYAAPV